MEGERLIRFPEVSATVGLKRTAVDQLEKEGKFPRRLTFGRTVAWRFSEVQAWVQARIAERDAKAARKAAHPAHAGVGPTPQS